MGGTCRQRQHRKTSMMLIGGNEVVHYATYLIGCKETYDVHCHMGYQHFKQAAAT